MSSRIKEDVQKLFEFWCELKQNDSTARLSGTITQCFPESFRDNQVISQISDFAYPCEFDNSEVQSYSFVWTRDDSKFRFGFCRHDPKTRTAMVLITYLPWHDTFLKLLAVLNELRRSQTGEFESFLAEAYNKGVPERGSSLKLFYNAGQNHFTFQRPSQFELPSIPENHNLNLYYNFVDPKNMIAVFAAMLSERRIIFTSRRLDRLSSCIQAASAFLYPMVWQHIFIPILPMKMKDFLCAPMPYLIGVPDAVLRTMTPDELGEVVILNCDNNEFKNPFDDVRHMPPELVSQMKKHLSHPSDLIGDRISKIFLRILVQLIGGYRDAAKYSQGQKITWDRDTFIESRPAHLRNFLSSMMELQIFRQFIDERLDILNAGQGISDEFEMETLRYTDKMGKKGKNYRDFLRNVKDKTNPAVKSAVKSVKEGSRGVKSAYKDLKSKLRDITPPKSQFHISTSSSHSADDDMTDSHNHRHHSAPTSPVFLKRGLNNDLGHDVVRKPFSSYSTQHNNSTTAAPHSRQATKNGFVHYSSQSVMHNNNNINMTSCNSPLDSKSPTVSPSSSICSSDMNISQELQNHPLFKSPNIDRSLKPSNSLDYSGYRSTSSRLGGPIISPTSTTTTTTTTAIAATSIDKIADYSKSKNASSSLFVIDADMDSSDTDTIIPALEDSAKFKSIIQDKSPVKSKLCSSVDTQFDTPPDMPPPPIPPKRRNGSCGNLNSRLNQLQQKQHESQRVQDVSSNSSDSHLVINNSHSISSSLVVFDQFDDTNASSVLSSKSSSLSSSSSSSSSSSQVGNNTASATCAAGAGSLARPTSRTKNNMNNNGLLSAPIPAPRHIFAEPPKSEPEIVKDLISLDESNSSFELSDLDPLNQNAKPIPGLLTQSASYTNIKSTTLPSTSVTGAAAGSANTYSISNPLYPEFFPRLRNDSATAHSMHFNMTDVENELLRQYGLDKFHLTNGVATSMGQLQQQHQQPARHQTQTAATDPKRNWTTFD